MTGSVNFLIEEIWQFQEIKYCCSIANNYTNTSHEENNFFKFFKKLLYSVKPLAIVTRSFSRGHKYWSKTANRISNKPAISSAECVESKTKRDQGIFRKVEVVIGCKIGFVFDAGGWICKKQVKILYDVTRLDRQHYV